jgi:hypothetical protein
MIRFTLMILLCLMGFVGSTYAYLLPDTPVTITIHAESQSVYPGDTLSVVLGLGATTDFYYAGFELGFESSTFFLLSIEATGLSNPGVAVADLLGPDKLGGSISRTDPLPALGEGVFARLRFVVDEQTTPQQAAFTLSFVELANSSGGAVSVTAGDPLLVSVEEPVSDNPEPHWFDIAVWNLDGNLFPSGAQFENAGAQLALYGASFTGFATGYRGQSGNSNGWMGGTTNGAFWEVRVSTRGFTELNLSSRQFGSGSGPRDFLIFGQIGAGGDWIRLTPDTIRVSSSSWNTAFVDALSLPSEFGNQADVGLIWMLASEARIDNGLPMSSAAGTSRIDDIAIRGRQLAPEWVEVWPGDTNNDGLVNADDVLPLGTYWLYTGPTPARLDSVFAGRTVERWVPEAATFADTNGDGRVDYRDLKWVGMHFGQTRALERLLAGDSGVTQNPDDLPSLFWSEPMYAGDELVVVVDAENLGYQVAGVSWRVRFSGAGTSDALKFAGVELMGERELKLVTDSGEYYVEMPLNTQAQLRSGLLQFHAADGSDAIEGAVVRTGLAFSGRADFVPVLPLQLRFRAHTNMENGGGLILERLTVSDRAGQMMNAASSARLRMGTEVSVPGSDGSDLPAEVLLFPNTPNPFNPSTMLRFALPEAMPVRISVYDMTGRRVLDSDLGLFAPGEHLYRVDAAGWASGVYVYRLKAGGYIRSGKMLLLK